MLMEEKLENTVQKTIEALTRIQRFVAKYGSKISEEQMNRISAKLQELQEKIRNS